MWLGFYVDANFPFSGINDQECNFWVVWKFHVSLSKRLLDCSNVAVPFSSRILKREVGILFLQVPGGEEFICTTYWPALLPTFAFALSVKVPLQCKRPQQGFFWNFLVVLWKEFWSPRPLVKVWKIDTSITPPSSRVLRPHLEKRC